MSVIIYHNPKCSKSRETLNLLKENGIDPEIVLYMDTPPDRAAFHDLLKKLGLEAKDILRSSEGKDAGLSPDMDADALIDGLIANPRAIQRPIVVKGDRAVLGRPPENVFDLI